MNCGRNLAHDLDKDVHMSLSDFSSLHYDKQDVTSYDKSCFIGLKLKGKRM